MCSYFFLLTVSIIGSAISFESLVVASNNDLHDDDILSILESIVVRIVPLIFLKLQ